MRSELGQTEPDAPGAQDPARVDYDVVSGARGRCGASGNGGPGPARGPLHGEHGERRLPATATVASATATGCSGRKIVDGWQVELRRDLARARQPFGSSTGARRPTRWVRRFRGVPRGQRGGSACLETGRASSPPPSTRRSSAGAGPAWNIAALWRADPIDLIRLDAFNAGDHTGSLAERTAPTR